MARPNTPRFVLGDEVSHPDGRRGVIVFSLPRARDGKRFLMVQVTSPCAGKREWPNSWTPLLDYEGEPLISNRCQDEDCQRPFRAPGTFGLCRQCRRRKDEREARQVRQRSREGTVNEERDALRRPWRLREKAYATSTPARRGASP